MQRVPNADGILALLLLSGSTARIDNSWPLVPNCFGPNFGKNEMRERKSALRQSYTQVLGLLVN